MKALRDRYDVCIVGCTASKLDRAATARELYTGDSARWGFRIGAKKATRSFLLSAKYGLVPADEMLEPYDTIIRRKPFDWDVLVLDQCVKHGLCSDPLTSVLFLAPMTYFRSIAGAVDLFIYDNSARLLQLGLPNERELWRRQLPYLAEWHQPMKGLGIGFQRQLLKQWAEQP